MQKLWGFTAWLNSVSVTGIVALSSPVGGSWSSDLSHWPGTVGTCWPTLSIHGTPVLWGSRGTGALPVLTQLLDALLVLDEELHPWDVDVQAGSLWGPLHRRVKAAVILAVR